MDEGRFQRFSESLQHCNNMVNLVILSFIFIFEGILIFLIISIHPILTGKITLNNLFENTFQMRYCKTTISVLKQFDSTIWYRARWHMWTSKSYWRIERVLFAMSFTYFKLLVNSWMSWYWNSHSLIYN